MQLINNTLHQPPDPQIRASIIIQAKNKRGLCFRDQRCGYLPYKVYYYCY